jgi:hypothetical protein
MMDAFLLSVNKFRLCAPASHETELLQSTHEVCHRLLLLAGFSPYVVCCSSLPMLLYNISIALT